MFFGGWGLWDFPRVFTFRWWSLPAKNVEKRHFTWLSKKNIPGLFWWIFEFSKLININNSINNTVDGRNPAPVDMENLSLFTGFLCMSGGCLGFLNHQRYQPRQEANLTTWWVPNLEGVPPRTAETWTPQEVNEASMFLNKSRLFQATKVLETFSQKSQPKKWYVFFRHIRYFLSCQIRTSTFPVQVFRSVASMKKNNRLPPSFFQSPRPPLQMAIPQLVSHPRMFYMMSWSLKLCHLHLSIRFPISPSNFGNTSPNLGQWTKILKTKLPTTRHFFCF